MKIKVGSQYSGVISRGPYENTRPGFSVEIEFDAVEGVDPLTMINERQKLLQDICYKNFKACEEQAIVERINKERQDIKWYPDPDLKLMPSVTSVIGFDADMYCAPEDLAQYAAQSNLCHAQVAHFIATGQWLEAKDVPGTWTDIVIVTKGSLKLETNGWSFPDFLVKYPFKEMVNTPSSVNLEYRYGGTPDFIGIPEFCGKKGFEEVRPVKTLCDVKRTPEKVKNFKQISAYANLEAYKGIDQICIVPLNNKTDQGFSKPIFESDPKRVKEYFGMFLKDREAFRNRFGV